MTVEDLDRLVAALPEWERMPPPACGLSVRREWEEVLDRQRAEWEASRERLRAQRERVDRLAGWGLVCVMAAPVVAAVVAWMLLERP